MNVYEMLDKMACELRLYLDTHKLSNEEREAGEDAYNELVGYVTYSDGEC